MTRELHGNIAKKAWFTADSGCKVTAWRGPAACYDSVQDFTDAVKMEDVRDGRVFVLRLGLSGRQGSFRQEECFGQKEALIQAFGMLAEKSQAPCLVISGAELPQIPGTAAVRVSEPENGALGPLGAIRDGDTIALDAEAGSLYLYVADLERTVRRHESGRNQVGEVDIQ